MGGAIAGCLWLAKTANDPDPEGQLPGAAHDLVHLRPKVMQGHDPQHAVWQAAAELLGITRTEKPETWTSYGSSVLEGEVDGRAVHVSVRENINLRYTVTRVAVGPSFTLPAELDPVLTRETKQGMAFVSHAPRIEVRADGLVHEAIGIRDDPAEIAAVVRALVATVGGTAV
jgi:hypothetical protein